jgi:hypothetical protein
VATLLEALTTFQIARVATFLEALAAFEMDLTVSRKFKFEIGHRGRIKYCSIAVSCYTHFRIRDLQIEQYTPVNILLLKIVIAECFCFPKMNRGLCKMAVF